MKQMVDAFCDTKDAQGQFPAESFDGRRQSAKALAPLELPIICPEEQRETTAVYEREKTPIIDRHDLFASTVRLACDRVPAGRRPFEDWTSPDIATLRNSKNESCSSRLGSARAHPAGTAPTAWRKPFSARNHRDHDWTASTTSLGISRTDISNGSMGSYGVPIRHWRLPRQDAIPCRITGRRAGHGGDDCIRIFVRLPGGGRFGLWVPPHIPVGPLQPVSFHALISDELARPAAEGTGRLTPVKALLTQRLYGTDGIDTLMETEGIVEHSATFSGLRSESIESSVVCNSLKGLIEAVSGVPADKQRLVVGCRGPLEDVTRPIHKYDIGHGATLFLSIKNHGTRQDVRFLSSPALKKEFDAHHADSIYAHMEEFAKSKIMIGGREAKDIVELLPEWQDVLVKEHPRVENSGEIMFQDYMFLQDNHIFDKAARIRKKFFSAPRRPRGNF